MFFIATFYGVSNMKKNILALILLVFLITSCANDADDNTNLICEIPNILTKQEAITLAHSPDADDAFMFYALAKDKIDSGGLKFVHELKDIQSLNVDARNEKYDVTAISFGMYPRIADKYALLSSGSSIGDGYGPIDVIQSAYPGGGVAWQWLPVGEQ